MKRVLLLAALFAIGLPSCGRNETDSPAAGKSGSTPRPAAPARADAESPLQAIRELDRLPADEQPAALAQHIYRVADQDLSAALVPIIATGDRDLKRALLITVYEETGMRPPIVRLPVLLEIARQPESGADVRNTIMAELGTLLATDHGTSWGDWALALEEYLAETYGFIRVKE